MSGLAFNLTSIIDETTVRGQGMAALIQKYLTVQTSYGLRNLGDVPNLTFPIMFVEPEAGYMPDLVMMGKYQIELTFFLFWYVSSSNPVQVIQDGTLIGHALEKLFSNNALNDLGTASPPSHSFCNYPGFWTEVMNYQFKLSPTFKNPFPNPSAEHMRIGKGTVKIRDWIIR